MKTRKRNVSEDCLTISQRKISMHEIPTDLIFEIFSRLPSKSIARCRCVSKLWDSILRRPYFTDLFFKKSSTRPQLLFAYPNQGELLFFSTPQPQNLDEWSSDHLTANYHTKLAYKRFSIVISTLINGLVFIRDKQTVNGSGNRVYVSVICNPSTGQSLTLPRMKTSGGNERIRSFLGYDPVEKQFKVLSMTLLNGISKEHQVLTLGIGKTPWRMIECCIPHYPCGRRVISINGVLYYRAKVNTFSMFSMVLSFDFRSEKYTFVKAPFASMHNYGRLINYNGKLGLLVTGQVCFVTGSSRSFELYVLEDLEKNEWSKHSYELPSLWQKVIATDILYIVGMVSTNEIVLSPYFLFDDSFYVIYYNLERKAIRKVEIQGIGAVKGKRVYTFLNHVENVQLLQM